MPQLKLLFLTDAYATQRVENEYRQILRDEASIVCREKRGFSRLVPDSPFNLMTLAVRNGPSYPFCKQQREKGQIKLLTNKIDDT